jgi:hypothetical protein
MAPECDNEYSRRGAMRKPEGRVRGRWTDLIIAEGSHLDMIW